MYYLGKSTESFPCDLSAKIKKLELVVYTVLQKKGYISVICLYNRRPLSDQLGHF